MKFVHELQSVSGSNDIRGYFGLFTLFQGL